MGAVKVSQLEEQAFPCGNCSSALGAPPPEVCCRPMGTGSANDGKKVPGKSGEPTIKSLSDENTEYAYVSDEDEDLMKEKQEGNSPTETSATSTPPDSPQAAEVEYSPTASPSSPQEAAATCIIFDWDDTLLPTSFLGDMARVHNASQFMAFGMASPMETVSCQDALKQHGDLIRRVLTSACELGHVAIVTSSVRPWVDRSAEQHLPGLDTAQLFSDLNIPVLYAPESWNSSMDSMGVVEAYTACKRTVMSEFLNSVCGEGRTLKHAISIGDSPVERDAMRQAVQRWEQPVDVMERPLCKTIKFMGDPSLKQLSNELQFTMAWLERIVAHDLDADVVIDPWDDVASKLRNCFGPVC